MFGCRKLLTPWYMRRYGICTNAKILACDINRIKRLEIVRYTIVFSTPDGGNIEVKKRTMFFPKNIGSIIPVYFLEEKANNIYIQNDPTIYIIGSLLLSIGMVSICMSLLPFFYMFVCQTIFSV